MAVKILAEMGWFIFAMGICGSTDYTPVCKAVYLSRFDMCIIQTESRYYNMELNLDKCINLTLNRKQSSIKFADGSLVPRKHTATYLGTLLTDNVDNKQEVMNRIADSIRTCNRLKLFWTKARNSIPWKIQVFHSILRSKLLYGLETIQLNQSELHRLDAFQIKGYRRILHIPPTSVDRTMTNASVKELIQRYYGVTIIEFSKLWLKRKIQLLGHIIRSDPQDPMRQVLFLPNSLIPRTEHARRVGKPRAHWLIETYADAYRESGHVDQFDINNILQRNLVNELAQQRLNIFSWHSIAHLFTKSFITESFVTESSHHRKLRQRKFRHRKRAYSRPGLRNKRCLHTLFAPFASVPPPLVW